MTADTNDPTSAAPFVGRACVLGASGYVGGRLVAALVAAGVPVRAAVRSPERLQTAPWYTSVEVVAADTMDVASLHAAFADCTVVYHLVHAMSDDANFAAADRKSAANVADAAATTGVTRIVYLGGLGDDTDPALSTHLASRHEVGHILAAGPVPVTELRAAVILGSGSASFEMLRSLTEVLPAMVVPRWASVTRCQPIAIRDVLEYLVRIPGVAAAAGQVLDIGGPDVVTYAEMMQAYATAAGLRRRLILPVPVLSPRLSSHWINVVTPLPIGLARHLVDSLVNDVVVRADHDVRMYVPHTPLTTSEAINAAITRVRDVDVATSWSGATGARWPATPQADDPVWAGGTVLADERVLHVAASPAQVFAVVSALGGHRGWYATTPLWRVRGAVDKALGGVGMRRGRRHPSELAVGDTLDSFRVEAVRRPHLVRLRAEMRLPGHAWLEWAITPHASGATLTQRARFVPRGLAGRVYWYALWPFHAWVFPHLARKLAADAEALAKRMSGPRVAPGPRKTRRRPSPRRLPQEGSDRGR